MNPDLNGITLDGVPIEKKLDRVEDETAFQVSHTIKDAMEKHCLYKQPCKKYRQQNGRRNKVTHKWFEVNNANLQKNIVAALNDNDPKKAIVAVILASKEPVSLKAIYEIIKERVYERNLTLTEHSLRTYIGKITSSKLEKYIECMNRTRKAPTTYRIKPEFRDTFSINAAMERIATTPKKKRKPKKEKKENKLASFNIESPLGNIEVSIFGKIQIEFSFK
jgi:hypothetical protein